MSCQRTLQFLLFFSENPCSDHKSDNHRQEYKQGNYIPKTESRHVISHIPLLSFSYLKLFFQFSDFSFPSETVEYKKQRYHKRRQQNPPVKIAAPALNLLPGQRGLIVVNLRFFPFVSPIIGALGAFITGSGTSTEVLLGSLQTAAAEQIGASQFWLAAANSTGAGIGKILSPQCIATAAAAVGLVGQDSKLLGGIIKWAVLELVIACLLVGLLGGIVPPILGV